MSDPGMRIMRERAAQYRREASRMRDKARTATTPAVRQQLIAKARQLDDLADGLEKAVRESSP
jgi:uncharacterized protein Yka (UPF0111/DUF47 family)